MLEPVSAEAAVERRPLAEPSPPGDLAELLMRVADAVGAPTSPREAIQRILGDVCGFFGWELGHAWLVEHGELVSSHLWQVPDPDRFRAFQHRTHNLRFAPVVLTTLTRDGNRHVWLNDFGGLQRETEARAAGLKTTAGFPIGVEPEVNGLIELWTSRELAADPMLIELMAHVGQQLGRMLERRETAAALETSEASFRHMFETAPIGMAIVSRDARLLEVNPALARMLGYAPAELYLISVDTITHPIDREATRRRFAELDKGPARDSNQRRLLHKDGGTVWCVITGGWTRQPDGVLGHGVAVVQDVTAQKQSQDAVHELSGRLLHLQDQERRKIARQLHESPAQNLAALAVNLAVIQKTTTLEGRARTALDESIRLVSECSREIRTLSHLLHPPLLEEIGLSAALRWYVDGFVRRSAIDVVLDIPSELARLPVELETTLFRVVQESLTNIHHHSGSSSASIRLAREGGHMQLEIADRGVGMRGADHLEEGAPGKVGVGIAGMRERVRQLAGELTIETGPGGTRVRVNLPVPA